MASSQQFIKSTIFQKIKNLLVCYFNLFGLYILFFISVMLLQQIFPDINLKKYADTNLESLLMNNKLKAFVAAVIIAPILEELMFRTLIKPKISELLLFVSIWSLYLFGLFNVFEFVWYYKYLFAITCVISLFYILKQMVPFSILQRVQLFLEDYQFIVLQISSLLFGFMHIFNYVDHFKIDTVLFLLIVPRVLLGHMAGMIKIKNQHIVWSMLLHALNNGVVFIVLAFKY